tara:strand:- start:8742 stop:9536 length:795 start_codon:yes stop_codon:yes gene_type:complete
MKYNSSFAGENQDRFVLSVLDNKREGTYVEIGAQDPIIWNNTYLLETAFEWRGISLEIAERYAAQWDARDNPCVICDATKVDYNELFEKHSLPKVIDFLQLDIDPPSDTLEVLKRIDFDSYSFRVITFEHDLYRDRFQESPSWRGERPSACGHIIREESRKIFTDNQYTLLIPDVSHGPRRNRAKRRPCRCSACRNGAPVCPRSQTIQFEDWYINEKYMPSDTWKKFIGVDPVMDAKNMKENTKNLLERSEKERSHQKNKKKNG